MKKSLLVKKDILCCFEIRNIGSTSKQRAINDRRQREFFIHSIGQIINENKARRKSYCEPQIATSLVVRSTMVLTSKYEHTSKEEDVSKHLPLVI